MAAEYTIPDFPSPPVPRCSAGSVALHDMTVTSTKAPERVSSAGIHIVERWRAKLRVIRLHASSYASHLRPPVSAILEQQLAHWIASEYWV